MAERSRVTVVETVYHQTGEGHTTPIESKYQRFLGSVGPGYLRLQTVGEDWQPLDVGWVQDASFLHIRNEKPRYSRVPTAVEQGIAESKVLELRMEDSEIPFSEVRVGESIRINPMYVRMIQVRCRSGEAKFTVNVLPE